MTKLPFVGIALAMLACVGLSGSAFAAAGTPPDADFGPPMGPPIHAVLTSPPNVPPPIHRNHAAKLIVELEIREVEKEISEGVHYTFWTFGGTVPGRFIRVRQGDTVEFHLRNHPDSPPPIRWPELERDRSTFTGFRTCMDLYGSGSRISTHSSSVATAAIRTIRTSSNFAAPER